jgi:hypothetical protein
MGDLTRGETFAAGESVTHTRLHTLVEDATINAGAVTTTKIADGAVTNAKLDASLAMSAGKIALASGKLLGGNGSGAGEAVTVGATLSLAAATLGVATGGIAAAQLASDAVETAKIKDANVTLAKIVNVTDARLLGRSAGSAGAPQEISIGSGLSLAAGVLAASGGTSLRVAGSASKTDTFSHNTTTWTDITGLSVTFTPLSSSSTFIVLAVVPGSASGANVNGFLRLVRNGTAIGVGASAGSRIQSAATLDYNGSNGYALKNAMLMHYDSPATGSAITYKVQIAVNSGTAYVNNAPDDTDAGNSPRTAASLVVVEFP